MAINQTDASAKILVNREVTWEDKRAIEELGADTLLAANQLLWAEEVASTPAQAVTDGTVTVRTLYVLTEDVSVPDQESWKAGIGDWIPAGVFGSAWLGTNLFDGSDVQITVPQLIANGIAFNEKTGIATGDFSSFTKPIKASGHTYAGAKGVLLASGGRITAVLEEDITVTIDHDAANSYDPTGDTYVTQAEADAALTAASATTFKYLSEFWATLPTIILPGVTVTLNIVGELHPSGVDTDIAFDLTGKLVLGSVNLVGATSASYETVLASTAITASQLYDEVSAIRDPYADQAGATFVDAHKGYFAVFDTGDVRVIHEQEAANSRIRLTRELTSAPASVVIARPSSVLRNSDTPRTNAIATGTFKVDFVIRGVDPQLVVTDLLIDPFGVITGSAGDRIMANLINVNATFDRCVFDAQVADDEHSRSNTGVSVEQNNSIVVFDDCSKRALTTGTPPTCGEVKGGSEGRWLHALIIGGGKYPQILGASLLETQWTVMEECGTGSLDSGALLVSENSVWLCHERVITGERGGRNEFRGTRSGIQRAISIKTGGRVTKTDDGNHNFRMFVLNATPSEAIVALGSNAGSWDAIAAGDGWQGSAGNTGVACIVGGQMRIGRADWTFDSSGDQFVLGGGSGFSLSDIDTNGVATDLRSALSVIG